LKEITMFWKLLAPVAFVLVQAAPSAHAMSMEEYLHTPKRGELKRQPPAPAAQTESRDPRTYGSPDLLHAYLVTKKSFTAEECAQHAYELIHSAVGDIASKEKSGAAASDDKYTLAIACAPPKTVFFIAAGPPNDTKEVPPILAKLMKDFQGPNCNSCGEQQP
jgi:hypothetical protein